MPAPPPRSAITKPPHASSGSRRYVCDTPRHEDDPQLQRLFAMSMPGRVSLSLRAEPDYRLALGVQGDRHDTVVVRRRDSGQVVAMGSRSVRALWLNGRIQQVGYLGGLRNTPGVRLPRRLVAEAFDQLIALRRPGEADFDLTSILTDNHTARRALERGVRGMPRYLPIGRIDTLALRATLRRRLSPPLRRLTVDDLPAIQDLLTRHGPQAHARPAWTETELRPLLSDHGKGTAAPVGYESGGALLGLALIWDQRCCKQVVVDDISPSLKRWRPVINVGCRLAGRVGLPRSGEPVEAVFASHLAYPPEQPSVLRDLLRGGCAVAGELQAAALVVGLPQTQRKVIDRSVLRSARVTPSAIYAVHRNAEPPQLDARPVWPEVAVL